MELCRLIAFIYFHVLCMKAALAFPRHSTSPSFTAGSRTNRIFSMPLLPSLTQIQKQRPFSPIRKMAQSHNNSNNSENPLSKHKLPSPLILGSSSFTRKLILREMNIPFHILVRPIDEKSAGDRSNNEPHNLVLNVAQAKMERLVNAIANSECDNELPFMDDGEFVILVGDQVVTCSNQILEKPVTVEEAKQFVQMYATHPPSTVGSVILTHYPTGISVEGVDRATIYFKKSVSDVDTTTSLDLVDRLLQQDAPILSCAGGLMIEHPLVREHVDRIEGSEDSVMGLSKALVYKLLGELRDKLNSRGIDQQ